METLTTREAAALLNLQPDSMRTLPCKDGAVRGIEPQRAENGRLLWPLSEVLRARDSARR